MTRRARQRGGVHFAVVCCLVAWAAAEAAEYPRHIWTVADDTLSVPLGAIADVGVDAHKIVYLLDIQNVTVRRFDRSGAELGSLGHIGDGPGEFRYPRLVAARPAGGCLVVPDFHLRAACLNSDGTACAELDLSLITDRYWLSGFIGAARADNDGRLFVTTMASNQSMDANSVARPPSALCVLRLPLTGSTLTVLFSNQPGMCEESTVLVSEHLGHFMLRCWDVDAVGKLIYADPTGRYRVTIGHPVDGESRTIDLPRADGDMEALERLAKVRKSSLDRVPQIADVMWLSDGGFLVKPLATVEGAKIAQGGTIELFDSRGASRGRYTLPAHDANRDALYLRGGLLVIIEGGMSAMNAALMIESTPSDAVESDVIRVHAYDLTPE